MVVAIGFLNWAIVSPIDPLLLFVPGVVASIAQGLSMPNAQSGAIRVDADLTGTASGAVMFAQLLFGAVGAQVMGFVADGTAYPMAMMFLIWPLRPRRDRRRRRRLEFAAKVSIRRHMAPSSRFSLTHTPKSSSRSVMRVLRRISTSTAKTMTDPLGLRRSRAISCCCGAASSGPTFPEIA